MRVQAACRIEDDPQRAWSGDEARGELRVVGGHRAGADDDRIAQGAQPMQVDDVVAPGDELRIAAVRGDEAIEALTEMPDREGPRQRRPAQRQVQIEDDVSRIARGHQRLPSRARAPRDHRGSVLGHSLELPLRADRERGRLPRRREAVRLARRGDHGVPRGVHAALEAGNPWKAGAGSGRHGWTRL